MEIRESCKGCESSINTTDDGRIFLCCYMHLAEIHNCPCQECILKTVCEDTCDPFYIFQCLCEPIGKDWA